MIKIRALKKSDKLFLHKWINDTDIIKHTNSYRPIDEVEQDEWFNSIYKNKQQHVFGIELIEFKKLIGTCGLYEIDNISRKGELRMKIGDKNEWSKGFGKIALKKLLNFGFNDLNLNKVWLKVLDDNKAAIKIYTDAGFVVEGKMKEDMFIQGKYMDVLLMGFIK
jgi:RimJ/RimL family protein N-acetyltransferase